MRRIAALVLVVTACVRIQDSKPPDSATAIQPDTTRAAISDTSLRPAGDFTDQSTLVRGSPAAIIDALRVDSATTLTVVDSAPASRATESDISVLRRQLMLPVSGVTPAALFDSYAELRGGTRPHDAVDILAPRGTPVLSATSGRVLKLFTSAAGGLMVYAADSSDRFILMYAHLDAYAPGLAEGQALRQGQQIGVVGTTGNAPPGTPHLHFAIARSSDTKQWWKGAPLNPFLLLAR